MRPAHIKQQRAKTVRQIHKRLRAISREKWELGFSELEKPVRHGWYKEIVLTVNIERYKTRPYIEEVFEQIEDSYWGRTKKECDKVWNAEVSKYLIVRDMPTISKKQFGKLSEKAKRLCTPYSYSENKKTRIRYYVRIPKPAYRIKYTKAYITHYQIIDPMLESEEDLLVQKLEKKGYYELNERQVGRWKNHWDVSRTKRDRLASSKSLRVYRNMNINLELWERN